MQQRFRRVAAVAALLFGGATVTTVHADPQPPFIAPDADWLTTVNYYRAMANQPPVVENPASSAGSYNHSCYMLLNGISHDEQPNRPGYSPEGDAAGNNGNVAVSSVYGTSARSHIELWMTGPFHAVGMLRSGLQSVGFGKCDSQSTAPWRSGATLDILSGLANVPTPSDPIVWPADGMSTSLSRFIVESPDPRPFCGYSSGGGLPVIAMMPEAVSWAQASIVGPSGPLETCALSGANTSGVARSILNGDNAVIAMPRNPLEPGAHTVTVTTNARTVSWTFKVDPDAALGAVVPPPTASPIGSPAAFQAVTPTRLVDTRIGLGSTPIRGGVTRTIQVTGRAGVPTTATAVSANFTAVVPDGAGYLTVWNCSSPRPVVSTLNFNWAEVVPNGATVPLDSQGRLCVWSPRALDLVVDVNGYYDTAAPSRFAPLAPTRVMDTREGLGWPGRLGDGQTTELPLVGRHGVPSGASAVVLNVTSVLPDDYGFVTVYPCGSARPTASSLNPAPGRIRPNIVIVPLDTTGKVCFYASDAVDLVVDLNAYLAPAATFRFTPTAPFRFVDTRDFARPAMHNGTGGARIAAGQTLVVPMAGVRGIPASADAVSINLTTVDAVGGGFVTAWPCGARPTVSTANYAGPAAVANGAQVALSAAGQLCIYAHTSTHVIIDVNGWWN
jgi:hypothetical protein